MRRAMGSAGWMTEGLTCSRVVSLCVELDLGTKPAHSYRFEGGLGLDVSVRLATTPSRPSLVRTNAVIGIDETVASPSRAVQRGLAVQSDT
jgi:hypothetical protein